MNIQSWFPIGLIGMISLQSKGLLRVFSSTIIQKDQLLSTQPSLCSNSHICTWLLGKNRALTTQTFHSKVMLKNLLPRFVIVFLPRSSVQFSHSVMSDTLQPHILQHTRLPCPWPTPMVFICIPEVIDISTINLDSSLSHPTQHFPWCTLHRSQISRVTIYSLVLLSSLESVCCSMADSNCCFFTCIQVS